MLSFSFSDKDLISYFARHPDAKIKCYYWSEKVYFLQDFSCEIFYSDNIYHILFFRDYQGHNISSQIKFINTGTSDKPNFEIIYQDPFYDMYTKIYKHFFYKNSRVLFYNPDKNIVYFLIRYTKGINQYLDNKYHSIFYFYTDISTPDPSSCYLNKVFTSKSSEFYKTLDSENFSPQIPTLTLDKIKSIYQMALKEQHCFKSSSGCVYKAITLFDTIAIQNPDISKPLVMKTSRICHNIENFPSDIQIESYDEEVEPYFHKCNKAWKFHRVLIYRASDDKKIYVLDPYFLEEGVIEYNQWISEYLKATNDFKVKLYQRID